LDAPYFFMQRQMTTNFQKLHIPLLLDNLGFIRFRIIWVIATKLEYAQLTPRGIDALMLGVRATS
jgi:hypothetical protein